MQYSPGTWAEQHRLDKLEESRRFIEGFGLYGRDVALLLDDENDAKREFDQLV
ncbi:MAG: hypothetical protein ACJ780_20030 [Solirubrobacteraceae bacterium]